jgi:hypothetical protein
MNRPTLLTLAAALLGAFLLCACGGGEDDSSCKPFIGPLAASQSAPGC